MNLKKALRFLTREGKAMILKEAYEKGEPVAKVAAEYSMSDIGILHDGKFQYEGKMVTPEEWHKINPLGEYGRLVIVGTREEIEQLEKTRKEQETTNNK